MSDALHTRLTSLLPPYAVTMGMRIDQIVDGVPILTMDFSDRTVGRPGFIHGGAIGGLLEIASIIALRADLGDEGAGTRIKPVNVSIEYLRGGVMVQTFAIGQVIRAGRRIANVRAEAWQSDRDKPLASSWMNFLLKPKVA